MVAFATQVKRRRGTTAQNDAFTGAEGEIVVDTQKHTLRVHDGVTMGGFEMARQADLDNKADTSYIDGLLATKANTDLGNIPTNYDYVVESQLPTADNSYTWYRKYKSGWVEQGARTDVAVGNNNITLPIVMLDVNYTALITRNSGASSTSQIDIWRKTSNDTTTTFCVYAAVSDTGAIWTVSGMSA